MQHYRTSAISSRSACLAAAALALLGLALPATAQAPPTSQNPMSADLVPLKTTRTLVTPDTTVLVPTDPPVLIASGGVFKGESELFGPFTESHYFTIHLGADGNPLYQIGEAVSTMTNGDAISSSIVVLFLPPTTAGVVPFQGAFNIRSGRGRFLGATGSGIVRGERDLKTGAVTLITEGLVTRPK